MHSTFQEFLLAIVFLSTVYFHTSRRNVFIAVAYGLQSLVIAAILFGSFLETGSPPLLAIVILVVTIKVIVAPRFCVSLIKKHGSRFTSTTYASLPLTLIAIAALTALAHGAVLSPLSDIVPGNAEPLSLSIAVVFVSLFLMINRKGALSQIIGILSLENGIVAFGIFAGLEQSAALQVGILFDIVVWLVIATVFVSMIYDHFGSLDVTTMNHLKE